MGKNTPKRILGLTAIGLFLVGFVVMYYGIQSSSQFESAVGIAITAGGALFVVYRF